MQAADLRLNQAHKSTRALLFALLLVPLALAAAWHWTAAGEMLDLAGWVQSVEDVKTRPTVFLWLIGVYLAAGLLAVPVTLVIGVTAIVFGPMVGFVYSLTGATLSASLGYGIGHLLGHRVVRRPASSGIDRLSFHLGRNGVVAVIVVRMLPIAPFTVVNMLAGASHISLRHFVIGTAIGMAPSIAVISLFVNRMTAALHAPGLPSFLGLAALIGLIAIGILLARHRVQRLATSAEPVSTS